MIDADGRIEILRDYADAYVLSWFVETGTADGYTTAALADHFERLVTIELDYERYLHVATTQFMQRDNVLPLWGDSARVLREVAQVLPAPALVWLDAHYSGGVRGEKDTPVEDELNILGGHVEPGANTGTRQLRHVILIDDARLFGSDPAYPTLDWVRAWADGHRYSLVVAEDIIRLTPLA